MAVRDGNAVVTAVVSERLKDEIARIAELRNSSMSKVIAEMLGTYALDRIHAVTPEGADAMGSGLARALINSLVDDNRKEGRR